jgi:hypothetical protein
MKEGRKEKKKSEATEITGIFLISLFHYLSPPRSFFFVCVCCCWPRYARLVNGRARNVVAVSEQASALLSSTCSRATAIALTMAGTRLLSCSRSFDRSTHCNWKLDSDSLPLLAPALTRRRLTLPRTAFVAWLQARQLPVDAAWPGLSQGCTTEAGTLASGSVAVFCAGHEEVVVPGFLMATALHLYLEDTKAAPLLWMLLRDEKKID